MCKRYPGQASALSVIASSLLLTCVQATLPREGRTLVAKLDWRF